MKEFFKLYDYRENVNLKKLCTFRIGGTGDIIYPRDVFELKKVVKICKKNKIKYIILGNGSNVLFPDGRLSCLIISLSKFNSIEIKKNNVYVGAGVNLFYLNKVLSENNLSGLEFSFGIPGTMGGFVKMNGGAFGHEICEFIDKVKILKNGKIISKKRKKIAFSYRNSNIDGIILGCTLNLKYGENVAENMQKYFDRKLASQPYEEFSAGSVFKRNLDIIPAKIIDNMGLKGVKINGAEVSKKHAGFIVNNGNATASDVKELIALIRQKTGFNFQLEIVDYTDCEVKNESGDTTS